MTTQSQIIDTDGLRDTGQAMAEDVDELRAALAAALVKADQLAQAVVSNRRIGVAVGLVMARDHVDAVHAFQALRRRSMTDNRKLAEIAEDVIYLRRLPATVHQAATD